MDIKGMGFSSKSIHAGHEHEGRGAHITPIYQVSILNNRRYFNEWYF